MLAGDTLAALQHFINIMDLSEAMLYRNTGAPMARSGSRRPWPSSRTVSHE